MSKEAIKLALEALEQLDGIDTETECVTIDVGDVITALREALAEQPAPVQQCMDHGECFVGKCIYPAPQPAQQEPVAWLKVIATPGGWWKFVEAKPNEKGAKPVYTSPPAQRKPLTDEEMADFLGCRYHTMSQSDLEFFRLGEAAHGIKEQP